MRNYQKPKSGISSLIFYIFATGVTLTGLTIFVLGLLLVMRGGSLFYLVSGALLLASGVQLFRRSPSALDFVTLTFFATWIWALAEVGLDGWALLPRVDLICVLLPFYYLPLISNRLRSVKPTIRARLTRAYPIAALLLIAPIATLIAVNARVDASVSGTALADPRPATAEQSSEWRHFGNDFWGDTVFAPCCNQSEQRWSPCAGLGACGAACSAPCRRSAAAQGRGDTAAGRRQAFHLPGG